MKETSTNPTLDVIKAYMLKRGMVGVNKKGRKDSGITELAREIGVSQAYIYNVFSGNKKLSDSSLKRICEVLHIDYGALKLLDGAWKGEYRLEDYGVAMDTLMERLDRT